jgi:hypothetical protein
MLDLIIIDEIIKIILAPNNEETESITLLLILLGIV